MTEAIDWDNEPDGVILNSMLWQLAEALGHVPEGAPVVQVDPADLWNEALDTIWRYRDLAE